MSKADELKAKNENLFEHNTILLNENERLKKENAELKKELSENKVADCRIVNGLCEQLTKAEEIIRELLTCARNYPESNKQKMQKAEQFLNEVEK